MRTTFVFMAATLLAISAAAQGPPADVAASGRAAMEKVAWLVGEWEGNGWMIMGPGGRSEFRGHESVASRLDGLVLVIEGTHRAAGGPREGQVIHHALAVLSWDAETSQYRFRSYLDSGRAGYYAGRVEAGAFIWEMDTPRGKIRYTSRRDDAGAWVETGERSADGSSWQQFFAMEMRKVGGSA